jgi:hypothetical protein
VSYRRQNLHFRIKQWFYARNIRFADKLQTVETYTLVSTKGSWFADELQTVENYTLALINGFLPFLYTWLVNY